MKKVYCQNCRYFWPSDNGDGYCYAPQNMKASFYAPKELHKEKPEVINVNNNCSYYKKSWWKFWVK